MSVQVPGQAPAIVPVTMGSPSFRSVDAGEIRATEAAFSPGDVLPMHAHARTIVAVMLDGGFELVFSRRGWDCPAGTVFVEPAELRHANTLGRVGARAVVLEVDPEAAGASLRSCQRFLTQPGAAARNDVAAVAWRLQREIRRADSAAPLAVEALALELVALAANRTDRDGDARGGNGWVSSVRDLLHAHLDRSFRVSDIAREVGVHRVHLGRVFRARYGESLGAYHRRLRIEWAARQLLVDEMSVGDIALRAGFADQPHFTRFFKRIMGMTPNMYARLHAGRRIVAASVGGVPRRQPAAGASAGPAGCPSRGSPPGP